MCGLFGFSGDVKKDFNWDKFKILGIQNDTRGGDASGLAVKDDIRHFSGEHKLIEKAFEKYWMPALDEEHNIVLGQTRKSSRSLRDFAGEEYIQPISIYNEDDELVAVGMHNGTLKNHEELAEEYGVPEFMTYVNADGEFVKIKPNDSMVLLYILTVLKDYSVIKKYDGAATLVWYDVKEDDVKIYSGASWSYNSVSRERPIYMLRHKDSIWWSSLKNPLYIINDDKNAIIESFEVNQLYTINNGIIVNVDDGDEFDRSEVGKKPDYGYGYRSRWEDSYGGSENRMGLPQYTPSWDKKDEIIKKRVWLLNGKFMFKEDPINGIYHIDNDGYVIIKRNGAYADHGLNIKENNIPITRAHYFYQGVEILDSADYNKITRLAKNDLASEEEFTDELIKAAAYPTKDKNGLYVEYDRKTKTIRLADGEYYFHTLGIARKYSAGYLAGSDEDPGSPDETSYTQLNPETDGPFDDPSDYNMTECPVCEGEGHLKSGEWCSECNGNGYVSKEKAEITKAEDMAYNEILIDIVEESAEKLLTSMNTFITELSAYEENDNVKNLITVATRIEGMMERKVKNFKFISNAPY